MVGSIAVDRHHPVGSRCRDGQGRVEAETAGQRRFRLQANNDETVGSRSEIVGCHASSVPSVVVVGCCIADVEPSVVVAHGRCSVEVDEEVAHRLIVLAVMSLLLFHEPFGSRVVFAEKRLADGGQRLVCISREHAAFRFTSPQRDVVQLDLFAVGASIDGGPDVAVAYR